MWKYKSIVGCIIILLIISNSYSRQLMTPETLVSLKRISDVQISPDGKYILFTITTPILTENASTSHLYIIPINGGEPRQLTFDGKHNSNGVWSPKGDKIAFLSDRDGTPQIFILDLKGGDPLKLTNVENGASMLSWSPDGKFISFVSDVKLGTTVNDAYNDLPKAKAYVYDHIPIRHWDEYNDENFRHLFVVSANGGEPKDLVPGDKYDIPLKPFGNVNDIAWSPNSSDIAYVSKKVDDYAISTNSDIYIVSVLGGSSKNITMEHQGFDMHPAFSPDGKWIAFQSQARAGYEADRVRLMLLNRSSGRFTELSKNIDQWMEGIIWSPNSQDLYCYAGNNDGTMQIYKININGTHKVITSGEYNHGDRFLAITPDGKTLIFSRRNYNRNEEIYSMPSTGGEIKQLTDINAEIFNDIKPVKIEARWITSTDGKKVHCWIVYPPDFDYSKKYPMITYCQGGPQQPVSQHFSFGWNFLTMASQGYIILAPNRRGCPGFGQQWIDAINKDYGGMAMQDILAATDEIAKEPYVDKNRLAAIGGSAGGYATFWLEGNHKGRFKAFVAHCGMFNMVSKYGSTEELWFPNWDNGGPYWDPQHKPFYDKHSPHNFVLNWDTPILIITGEKDYRVPYTQSLEAFTAAQLRKIPSRILIYPEENHWVLHPQEQILWYREFFRFLDIHCKSKIN